MDWTVREFQMNWNILFLAVSFYQIKVGFAYFL